jgi:enoyl-CoA hydratase/carnithine racemase
MSETTDFITKKQDGAILYLGFNRPERKNAISGDMYQMLADSLNHAAADDAVRVVLLHGNETTFTAGNDLEDFLKKPPHGDKSPVFQFLQAVSTFPKPLIAAVSGVAVGVGVTMLMHCDLVYVADNAKLSVPFAQLGLCPEAASSFLLPFITGYQRAAEKFLLGEPFGAQECADMGLANKVLPVAELLAFAAAQATKLTVLPASSLRATKQLMKSGMKDVIAARMQEESVLFRAMLSAPEAREAFTAFMQKRKPDFVQFS